MDNLNKIPEEIVQIEKVWKKLYLRWWIIHYIIGLIGTLSAITVASNPTFIGNIPHFFEILTWLSALSIASITFLDPKKRARAYVAAWRLLHEAMGNYRYSEKEKIKDLFITVRKGEEIIANLDS